MPPPSDSRGKMAELRITLRTHWNQNAQLRARAPGLCFLHGSKFRYDIAKSRPLAESPFLVSIRRQPLLG